jgi:hypothetical protein
VLPKLLEQHGVRLEKPEATQPMPEVTTIPRDALGERRKHLYPQLNGSYAECFERLKLWQLRVAHDASLRFHVDATGSVTRVDIGGGDAPQRVKQCLAREIRSRAGLPVASDGRTYDVVVRWRMPASE